MKKISSILLSLGLVVGLCPLGILSHTALKEPKMIQAHAQDYEFEITPTSQIAEVDEQLMFTFQVNFDAIGYVIRTKGQDSDHYEVYAESHDNLRAHSAVSFALREDKPWKIESYVTVFYGSGEGEYITTDVFSARWFDELFDITFDMDGYFPNGYSRVPAGTSLYGCLLASNLPDEIYSETDDHHYLLGFNTKPLSEYSSLAEFAYEAKYTYEQYYIEDDTVFYSAFGLDTYDNAKFNRPEDVTLKNEEFVEPIKIGEMSFSGLNPESIFVSIDYMFPLIRVKASNLVNKADAEDVVPLELVSSYEWLAQAKKGETQFSLYDASATREDHPFKSLAGSIEYIYVDSNAELDEVTRIASDLSNKIFVCNRGGITFNEKIENALEYGAAGVIVINNQSGVINMAVDPDIPIPCASALKETKEFFMTDAEKNTIEGVDYYYGALNILPEEELSIEDYDYESGTYFSIEDIETGASTIQNLYMNYDTSLIKEESVYTATLTYSLSYYDDWSQESMEPIELNEKTTITIDTRTKIEPDNPGKSGLPAGAIVGIVLGSLVLLAGIGVGVFFLLKKKGIIKAK